MESKNTSWGGIIAVVLIGLLCIGVPIAIIAANVYDNLKVACEPSTLPFETQTVGDSNLDIGKTEVRQAGVNGQEQICKLRNGNVASRKLLSSSTPEVVANGLKETPAIPVTTYTPTYTQTSRVGAICSDGSRSYATGRGACSHHGGVSRWLYE